MINIPGLFTWLILILLCGCITVDKDVDDAFVRVPALTVNGSGNHDVVKAYRLAIGDIHSNIQPHYVPLEGKNFPCLYPGFDYCEPWTRDAAINTWNGLSFFTPQIAKNTLLAQIVTLDGKLFITHEYWDKIIWAVGAWHYYLATHDKEFLMLAYEAICNTLEQLEENEYNAQLGLFRGPAVYGDGVSAYPPIYTRHSNIQLKGSYSGISEWPKANPDISCSTGTGIPMHALSTNAIYYHVYTLMPQLEKALKIKQIDDWDTKASHLKKNINQYFWNDLKGTYDYIIDPFGGCDRQEGLGLSFVLLFNICNSGQKQAILQKTYVSPNGIPCLYPGYQRYSVVSGDNYGRHSGTIWPHIQGFWAEACLKNNYPKGFFHEFNALTKNSIRDHQFYEIYHPDTGLPYGGIQEPTLLEGEIWNCGSRQSWSATAYLRMIFFNILGIRITTEGIIFQPHIPDNINLIEIKGLLYNDAIIDLIIKGKGNQIKSVLINQKNETKLKASYKGSVLVEIEMI